MNGLILNVWISFVKNWLNLFPDSLACRHRPDHAQHGGHPGRHTGCASSTGAQLHQLRPRAEAALPAGPVRRRGPHALAAEDPPVPVGTDPAPNDAAVGGPRNVVGVGRADDAQLAGRPELDGARSWMASFASTSKVARFLNQA